MAAGQREGDLWVYAACVAIGLWLLSATPTFSYMASAAGWSELIAGLLAVILGLAGLASSGAWAIQPSPLPGPPLSGREHPLQDPAKTPENAESDAQPDARQTADAERQDADPSAGETKDLSGLLNQQLADLPEELQGAFKILLQYAANRSQK